MVLTDIISKKIEPFYSDLSTMIINGDSFDILTKIKESSIDMIFADPPYFLSNGGITCHSGKQVSVNKGDWDKIDGVESKHDFNRRWIKACLQVLKDDGSIWVSGTLHNIYSIGMALEQEGFVILNNITWQKTNPPPNLACRCFTHSTETILWACKADHKSRHHFNYKNMKEENGGKQMKDVWTGPLTPQNEKLNGSHPTQKPLYLLNRIISASTEPNDIILDPFCGSATTGVAAKSLGRFFIGIDNNKEYCELSMRRISQVLQV